MTCNERDSGYDGNKAVLVLSHTRVSMRKGEKNYGGSGWKWY